MKIQDLLSNEVEEPSISHKINETNQQATYPPPTMTDVTPATANNLVLQIEETHQMQTYLSQSTCISSTVIGQLPPKRKRLSPGMQQESNPRAFDLHRSDRHNRPSTASILSVPQASHPFSTQVTSPVFRNPIRHSVHSYSQSLISTHPHHSRQPLNSDVLHRLVLTLKVPARSRLKLDDLLQKAIERITQLEVIVSSCEDCRCRETALPTGSNQRHGGSKGSPSKITRTQDDTSPLTRNYQRRQQDNNNDATLLNRLPPSGLNPHFLNMTLEPEWVHKDRIRHLQLMHPCDK